MVFHTPTGDIVLCEIASRIGGAKIVESINYAYKVDIRKVMVQSQCGIFEPLPIPQQAPEFLTGFVLIPPQAGRLMSATPLDLPDWVLESNFSGKIGTQYNDPKKSTDSIASFVVKGETEEQVVERLERIVKLFNEQIVWHMSVE